MNEPAKTKSEATAAKRQKQTFENDKAMAEYRAANKAAQDKTTRLRALRLAKEAEDAAVKAATVKAAPAKKRRVKATA